jgi:hypothetical protein
MPYTLSRLAPGSYDVLLDGVDEAWRWLGAEPLNAGSA